MQNNKKRITVAAISVLFLILTLLIGAYLIKTAKQISTNAANPSLVLTTNLATPKVNDQFVAAVSMDTQGVSVTGIDLTVNYDPNILTATSIQPGGFLPYVFIGGSVATAGKATIVLGCPIDTAPRPVTGVGLVATINFTAKTLGSTNITFDNATKVSVSGQTTNQVGPMTPVAISVVANPSLVLTTNNSAPKVNEGFLATVTMNTQGASVTGVDLTVDFDQNLLTGVSIQPGTAFPQVYVGGTITNGVANIVLGCPIDTVPHPVTGTGIVVATINFTAKAVGTTTLRFNALTKVSTVGQTTNQVGTTTPATLTVLAATPSPTPTRSPSPTPSPTPTRSPSPSPTRSPSPSPSPSPVADLSLKCLPVNQSASVGANVSFSAVDASTGVAVNTATWTATGGTPSTGTGATFTTRYSVPGTYIVTPRNAAYAFTANCNVNITATPSPSPSPTPNKIGDVNLDGVVNIIDIGIIIDTYDILPLLDPRADLNHDGAANIIDIGIVIDYYGT